MGWFVFALIIGGIGLILLLVRRTFDPASRDGRSVRTTFLIIGMGFIFAGGLTILLDSVVQVAARTVGVPITFGHVGATMDPGWHWKKPWTNVERVDATAQNINLNTDLPKWNTDHICTAVQVRLANNTTACVDLTGQWNIDPAGETAALLWQKYRGKDDKLIQNVDNNVVRRELQRAMNNAFEKYNPLAHINDPSAVSSATALNTQELSQIVLADMRRSVDPGIVMDKLIISIVHFDGTTQAKLDGFAQALADTQIATQQKLTAEQQKEANDLLAAASSNDPGVKWQNCLNLLLNLAAKDQLKSLPPAFTCNADNSTPVIIGRQ